MEKNQIITGIINGDRGITNQFYQKQINYIKGYILNNQGNKEDVKDTVQEAMMELYKKLKFEGLVIKGSINTYFFRNVQKHMADTPTLKKKIHYP